MAVGVGLALVTVSAVSARIAEDQGRAQALVNRMASIDGALLSAPTALSVLWRAPTSPFQNMVAATGGMLVQLSDDRTSVAATDADSGTLAWRHSLPAEEHYPECVAPPPGGTAFTCLIGHGESAFALVTDAVSDGTELSRVELPDTTLPTLLATHDADVLLAQAAPDGSGTVTRRSPVDGTVRWTRSLPRPGSPPADTALVSAVQGGVVWLSGSLRAILDLATGAPIDQLPAWVDGQYPDVLPLPDGATALWGMSVDPGPGVGNGTGVVIDRTRATRFTFTDQPLACRPDGGSEGDTLLLSTGISLRAVDARTGAPRWQIEVGQLGMSGAVCYGGSLDLVGSDGTQVTLEQHDLRTGDRTWSTTWAGVGQPQQLLAGGVLLLTGASAALASTPDYRGGADHLATVDLSDGSLHELPWPDGLPAGAFLTVLDHRLYGVTTDQTVVRLG